MEIISIIIPVYNSGKYLKRCLDSILNQTYRELEIICINDFSSDNSSQILEDYRKKDYRIRIINNSENKGVSYSRNRGIQEAHGDWISFIDSDDWILPDMYNDMVSNAKLTNSEVVMSDLIVTEGTISKDYSLKLCKGIFHKEEIKDEILPRFSWEGHENLGLFSFTTKLFRSRLIKDNHIFFDINTSYEEDKMFIINIFAHCECLSYINRNYYKYEVSTTGLYSSFNINAWKWYVYNYCEKQSLIKKYNIKNVNQVPLKEEFIYNLSWFIKRCSYRLKRKESNKLRHKVLKDSEVTRICKECIPYLSSIDKKIAQAIVGNNLLISILLIKFNFSPYKGKILSIVKRLCINR